MAVRRAVGLVQAVRIYQCMRQRKLAGAFVMIDHDHIHAGFARSRERLERLCAAIDRHDQLRAAPRNADQRFARGAVTLHQPVGDIGLRRQAEVAQQAYHDRGRRGAIDIIIAEHGNRLAALDRVRQARCSLVHVAKYRRIGHEGADRGVAVIVECLGRTAPGEQQLRDQIVGAQPICRSAAPVPCLAGDGLGDV